MCRVLSVDDLNSNQVAIDDNCAVYMDELSVPAVIEAARRGVSAILSGFGSPFAHGVNLLRAQKRLHGSSPALYGQLGIRVRRGAEIVILPDGSVITSASDIENLQPATMPSDFVLRDLRESTEVSRCYWPHRRYDPLMASLMIPGLQRDASQLAQKAIVVERMQSGHLWFTGGALSIGEMTDLAKDSDVSSSMVERQLLTYTSALELIELQRSTALRAERRIAPLASALSEYFSNFLLFHNTYEELLRYLCTSAREEGAPLAQLYDLALNSQINDWMMTSRILLPNKKDVLEDGGPIPVPPLTPFEDLSARQRAVTAALARVSSDCRDRVLLASKIFVAKEWKFFTNKVLMREFSHALRSLPDWNEGEFRELSIADLIHRFQ